MNDTKDLPNCPDTPQTRRGFALGAMVAAPIALTAWAVLLFWALA